MKTKFKTLSIEHYRALKGALEMATYLSRDPLRVTVALNEAMRKSFRLTDEGTFRSDLWASLLTIKEAPTKNKLLLAAVVSFLNPIDLIPDIFFGVGLTDDFAILTAVLTWAKNAGRIKSQSKTPEITQKAA
jgi:uncharacterized membrane protein YkvA (DUF1232 family)